jgi:hypothetical protein
VSDNISYVVFGPGFQNVTLSQCTTGATFVITGDTNLCGLDETNDNVCAIEIAIAPAAAPSMGGAGLGLIMFALLTLGGLRLRRRSIEQRRLAQRV